MPFCERCQKEVAPDALVAEPSRGAGDSGNDTGAAERDRCPTCGARLAESGPDPDQDRQRPKAPWHFKVLVVGSVGYLGYRLYQGITWLMHHA